MRQVIYIDVLLCVNLLINYVILILEAKLLNLRIKRKRLILSALMGSFYSIFIFFDQINLLLSLFIKLLMSITIILIAYGFINTRSFVKLIVTFYFINFIFGGIIFCIWYFISPKGIFIKNGIVYFDISPTFLILSTVVIYFSIKIYQYFLGESDLHNSFCDLEILNNGKTVKLFAKVDTGNSLKEPFSNKPVIVAEYESLKDILPPEVKNYIQDNVEDWTAKGKKTSLLRVIPYSTVSGEGLLPAFIPEKVTIKYKNKTYIKETFLAISKRNLFLGDYKALVPPDLID